MLIMETERGRNHELNLATHRLARRKPWKYQLSLCNGIGEQLTRSGGEDKDQQMS